MANTRDQIAAIRTRAEKSNGLKCCEETKAGNVCAHVTKEGTTYSLDGDSISYSELLKRIKAAKQLKRLISPDTQKGTVS